MISDIFDTNTIDLLNIVCHSGGAVGSDTYWEELGEKFGVKTRAYSYKTKYHISPNKIEISVEDYDEGILEVNKANHILNRVGIQKYMNLLSRNWSQVKYSNQVFAIGMIIKVGDKNTKGFYNKGECDIVDGGTGYAVTMAINNFRDVFVFDQILDKWFVWSYISKQYIEMNTIPTIKYQNFAGIGTRDIQTNGIKAILDVYKKTFKV